MSEDSLINEMQSEIDKNSQVSVTVPKGWEDFSEYVDGIGSAVTTLPRPYESQKDLLISAGFNPEEWQIHGPIRAGKWKAGDGWSYSYRFNVIAGESDEYLKTHIDDLVADIRANRSKTRVPKIYGDDAFLFLMADLQIGKAEGGIGTEDTIRRFMDVVDQAVGRVQDLRKIGRKLPHGVIVGMGDIVESCTNFYPNQLFTVDRNQRDQNKISRELIYYIIDKFYPLFEELTVACVPGNHGQNRNDGKAITDIADNADVACFESVKEAYDRAGVTNINWIIPQNEIAIAVPMGGVSVAFTHGDVFRKGSTPAQKALEWFRGQVFGNNAVKDCQILFSAHFHHFLATQVGERTLIQAPCLDPGSAWVTNASGERTPPGAVCIRISSDEVTGFSDLQILGPRE